MNATLRLISRIEKAQGIDPLAEPLKSVVGRLVRPRGIRNALSGSSMGHPLHPALKDAPIGAWTMSVLLDAIGGRGAQPAADLLIATGLATAVPTVAAGLNDWSDTTGADTRVGVVHAGTMLATFSLYGASLAARRRGHRVRGKALSLAGFAGLSFGGMLGGHLSFGRGVNVNRTAYENRPTDWLSVLADADLADGEKRAVPAGDASVLIYRDSDTVSAMASTCTHMGGPLVEGTVENGCIQCPWHGSIFRLADGEIFRGPASTPQPTYDVRIQDDQIEVRARD